MKKIAASVLGVLAGLALTAGAAFAEQVNYYITIDSNPNYNFMYKKGAEPTDNNITFSIENNSGKALFFESNGEKTYLPLLSERTVKATHEAGQKYTLWDEDSQAFYTWQVSDGKLVYVLDANTVAQHEKWAQTLSAIMASNRVTYQAEQVETRQEVKRSGSKTVRGYW